MLTAIMNEEKEIIYSISLGELAAILFIHLNEMEGYIILKTLIDDYKMKDLFIPGSPMLFQCFFIHDQFVEIYFPRISVHFVCFFFCSFLLFFFLLSFLREILVLILVCMLLVGFVTFLGILCLFLCL